MLLPLTAAAGIWDSSEGFRGGPIQSVNAQLNFSLLEGTPLFVALYWNGIATVTLSDDAGNTFTQVSTVSTGGTTNYNCALFQCVNPVSLNPSGQPITITASASVNVNHFYIVPFSPFVASVPQINNPPGVQIATFANGSTTTPSIATTLPHANDMLVAIVASNNPVFSAQPGWTIVQNNANGQIVLVQSVPVSGPYTAQPVLYPNSPDISMILFSMPAVSVSGLSVDNNGMYLPQGLTEARPVWKMPPGHPPNGDNTAALQNAFAWGSPFVTGVTLRIYWKFFQLNPPTWNPAVDFDWSYIDAALALAEANGMFINVIFAPGWNAPSWLINSGIPLFPTTNANGPFALPWDPTYQLFLSYLVSSIAARYDNNPRFAAINIAGFGRNHGMGFCSSQADNQTLAGITVNGVTGIDLVFQSFKQVTAIFAGCFRKTRLTVEFFNPIWPTNQTTQKFAVQWSQWILQFGSQFGIAYNNYNANSSGSDLIPEEVTFNFSDDHLSKAQPQHPDPTEWWPNGMVQVVAQHRAALCETYLGQLTQDTLGVMGYNSQLAVTMLERVANNWKPWTPQFPQLTFVPPTMSGPINQGGTFYLYTLLNSLLAAGNTMLRDVNGNFYQIEFILQHAILSLLYSIVYYDPNSKRITYVGSFAQPPETTVTIGSRTVQLPNINEFVFQPPSGAPLSVNVPPAPSGGISPNNEQYQGGVAPFLYDVVSPV